MAGIHILSHAVRAARAFFMFADRPVDGSYSSVSLLLHGNGTNGSTAFTDNSPSPKTPTLSGTPIISTAQSKYGGASMYFNGSSYLNYANNAAYDLSGDFTIEFWYYQDATGTGSYPVIMQRGATNTASSFGVLLDNVSNGASFYFGSPTAYASFGPRSVAAWTHLAVSRVGTTLYTFRDGNLVTTATVSNNFTSTSNMIIGNDIGAANPFKGYIDDLRITKGVGRYTASFTPPSMPHPDGTTIQNYNLKARAISAGWDQVSPLSALVTIDANTFVGSTNTGAFAFDTGVTFPSGTSLSLVNNGNIYGAGGAGGTGGNTSTLASGAAGGAGGPALRAQQAISITNNGTIAGGGGGGGGGGRRDTSDAYGTYYYGGGGGGGGRGFNPGAAGAGGTAQNGNGGAGAAGTTSANGGGGAGNNAAGNGGAGGGLGAAGSTGGSSSYGGGGGGAGGAAVNGNANITWVALGTRLGSIA